MKCAFIRGVNINGQSMKMAEVCNVFRQEELQNVSSVLATGNILFESTLKKETLRLSLEKRMSETFQSDIRLFIKEQDEIEIILRSHTFSADPNLHIYAFICENGFENILMEKFNAITPIADEKAEIKQGQFYWQVAKGFTLDAGFSKILGDKQIRDQFTSRNINTIQKIYLKMQENSGIKK